MSYSQKRAMLSLLAIITFASPNVFAEEIGRKSTLHRENRTRHLSAKKSAKQGEKICKDNAIEIAMKWFHCIERKNYRCAVGAYNEELFEKSFNNESVPELGFTDEHTWKALMSMFDFTFTFDDDNTSGSESPYVANVSYQREIRVATAFISMGYLDTDSYPFDFVSPLIQNESAVVTFDESCNILKLDVSGDSAQQDEYVQRMTESITEYQGSSKTKAPKGEKKGTKGAKGAKKGKKGKKQKDN